MTRVTRREFIARSFVAGAALAAADRAYAAGAANEASGRREARWPVVRRHEVPVAGLDPALDGLVVLHLSDVHVGVLTPRRRLERALTLARETAPDLVVLTGDYVWRGLGRLDDLEAWLRRLPGPAVATLGNHDHWAGAADVRAAMARAGIEVLANSRTTVMPRGRPLAIVGIDDGVTGHDDPGLALGQGGGGSPRLVLAHDPRTVDRAPNPGSDVFLSGHTHGGIIRPLGAKALARRFAGPYLAGWYRVGRARLYVNRGVGDSGVPVRIGRDARPEVARLVLRPAGV